MGDGRAQCGMSPLSQPTERLFRPGAAPKPRPPAEAAYCLRAMASASSSFDIFDRPLTPSALARS